VKEVTVTVLKQQFCSAFHFSIVKVPPEAGHACFLHIAHFKDKNTKPVTISRERDK